MQVTPLPSMAMVSGVILAGGRSRRLGTDKAFLAFRGRPLVAHVVETLAPLSDDLVVVTNDPAPYAALRLPARLAADEKPGLGSLMGIYSGLTQARYSYALVVACDMPFLSLPLLRYLITLKAGCDVVIPQVDGLFEPLHAVYGKTCLGPMRGLLESGERQIIRFFPDVRVRAVTEKEIDRFDPGHLSFRNANTPQDWEAIQALASSGSNFPQ